MPISLTGRVLTAAALVAALVGSSAVAYADEVVNDLDNTVDATAEALSLSVGGADGTVTLFVRNQNAQQGDLNGCNLAGSASLVVDVASSDQTVATVTPGQSTIAECGLGSGVALTVRGLKAGTSTVTVSRAAGSNPPGNFSFAPATFTVTVTAPANTAPKVRVAGAEDGAAYELGGYSPVPACMVTDTEDSPGSPISVAPVVVDDRDDVGLGQVSASCSYTDAGGLTASDKVTFTVVDTVAPTMQRLSLLPEPNAAGWNDSPVTATWGCFDQGSDVVAMEVSQTTAGEGANLSVTGTCEDKAGNTTTDTIDGLDVDLTDPVATIGRTPAANDNGWNDGNVTITWTCTDGLSGVTDAGGSKVLGEGADQSVTGICTDRAGNTASSEVRGVRVDKTPPVITFESRTAAYDDRGWNSGDVTVTWTCTDTGSGPVRSSVSEVVSTPGADQSVGATCKDLAGNTASATVGGINIDTTSPSIDISRDPAAANANGWNDSPVKVTWSCTDAGGAGIVNEGGSHVVGEGAGQSIGRTCTDHAGNTASGEVTGINVDLTRPVIEISRDPAAGNADGWSREAVTVEWTCTDALSGVTGPGDSRVLGEGADQSATGTCTDKAGNAASDTIADIDVDTTDPVIAISRTPATPGWSNTDVTVEWTCTDALSGVRADGDSATVGEGAGQSVTGTCTDKAGNTATDAVTDINVDLTDPHISIGRSPAANDAGWNKGDVTVTWTCTDALSGATDNGGSQVLGEGADQSATGTCTDKAGNTASDEVNNVDVDKTDPHISMERSPAANDAGWNNGDVTVTWTCTDLLSGVTDRGGSLVLGGEGADQSVSRTCTDHAGNTASSTVTDIRIDKTAPVITLKSRTAPYDDRGWNNADVTLTWTCTDTGSGPVDANISRVVDTPGADQTVDATCKDLAGNTASDTVGGINIDTTSPSIDMSRDPANANANGWNDSPVEVTWTCTDTGGSGIVDQGGSKILGEGAGQSVERSCTDHAGNTATDAVTNINVDLTDPHISIGRSPAPNADGWNKGNVTVAWTCTDALSGVTDTGGSKVLGEGANQSATGTCTDKAGNTASDEVNNVDVDKTAPTVSWIEPIGDGAAFYFGSVPPEPGCAATDSLSGTAGPCSVTGYGTGVGDHTLTARAVDVAGNETVLSRTYTVRAWTLNGYYSPVDMGGVWNTVKNGSTVPLKFEAFRGSAEITDVAILDAAFTVKGVACPGAGAPSDDVEFTTTGGTTFRYDAAGGQFIQNWQTPKKAGACYEVSTTTADGSRLAALFKLK